VYGGALKITTNGTDSLETLAFGVYDNRTAANATIATVSDLIEITTPAATVTAAAKFYPWNEGWYPGSPSSLAACHLLVIFIR
jgi:hypothetical protein